MSEIKLIEERKEDIEFNKKVMNCSCNIMYPSMEIRDTKIIKLPSGKC